MNSKYDEKSLSFGERIPDQKKEKEYQEIKEDAVTILKNYEDILKYIVKLLDHKKELLFENSQVKEKFEEAISNKNKLIIENDTLKEEREKLINDSLFLMECNQDIEYEKEMTESLLLNLKLKYEILQTNIKNSSK